MSLARDFVNYYGSTFVGYRRREGDPLIPFYVRDVRVGRNRNGEDYSVEAMNALRFVGCTVENGVEQDCEVTLSSGKLELEMPELGYVTLGNGRTYWLSFRPQRSMRKGLCSRRVEGLGGMNLGSEVATAIYKAHNEKPDPLQRHFHLKDGKVNYKGREVGTYQGDNYNLYVPYRYLTHFLRKVFGEVIQVGLVEEQENA